MKKYVLRDIPESVDYKKFVANFPVKALALTYWNKGITTKADLETGVRTETLLPIDELFDLNAFYESLSKHIKAKSKIVIYGDYDADGAVASSILWRFLSKVLKLDVTIYIPDRHEEGYGLNKDALISLSEKGTSLVITVDCGVRDKELIDEVVSRYPIEIIVTDHHQLGETFPSVVTVHPLYPNHESLNKYISGGVVVWKIVRYLEEKMGLNHDFSDSIVDLAGISLVTDIMPITGENKQILRLALAKLKSNPTLGIKAIMEHAQIAREKVSSYHLGYIIGPRLNASGRIGDQYMSSRLLCTDKSEYAYDISQKIHEVNVRRQDTTKAMFEDAEKKLAILSGKLIVTYNDNWDDGIIGLVAGKIMNKYDIPTIAISVNNEKNEAKGSARSFGDFNITKFLEKVATKLSRYGGHSNAAGFTLKDTNVEEFKEAVNKILLDEYKDFVPVATKYVDSVLTFEDITDEYFEFINKLEPFGFGNEKPIFSVTGEVLKFSTVGAVGVHLKFEIETDSGNLSVMLFNGIDKLKLAEQGKVLTFYGSPQIDEFRGVKQTTFIAEDVSETIA